MKKLLFAASLSVSAFAAQAQIVTNGLVDKYSFTNGSTNDEVGTNHLTSYGSPSPATDRLGNANSAMYFDGTSNVHTTTSCFYPGQPYSICFWYKISDVNKIKQNFFNTDPHTQLDIGYNWFGDPAFHIGRSSDAFNWNICSKTYNNLDTFYVAGINVQDWNYFVMTYDGTEWKTFNNGDLVNQCSSGTPSNTISQMIFGSIMAGVYTDFMIGYMDDIRIYNRAININEIDSLLNEGLPSTTSIANKNLLQNSVAIYPNPTIEKLNCHFEKGLRNAQISVVNVVGQVIQTQNNISGNQATLDVQSLPVGIYLLQVKEDGKMLTKKFVKE